MPDLHLRKAVPTELPALWAILQHAIAQRRLDVSTQWQDGYPNPGTVQDDLDKGRAYVLEQEGEIVLYAAIILDPEPAYAAIEGRWLTNGPYVVLHRVAIAPQAKGQGMGTRFFGLMEQLALERGVPSIKVDTNFDNGAMLRILEKLGYTYCGQVYFRGSARRAYEKVLGPISK